MLAIIKNHVYPMIAWSASKPQK